MYHVVKKDWGEEIWFANNSLYCGKKIVCLDHIWSSNGKFHYHQNKDETFFVIDGILELDLYDNGELTHYKLDVSNSGFRIRPYVPHRFRSHTKKCVFIEVSTYHDDEDSYRATKEELDELFVN